MDEIDKKLIERYINKITSNVADRQVCLSSQEEIENKTDIKKVVLNDDNKIIKKFIDLFNQKKRAKAKQDLLDMVNPNKFYERLGTDIILIQIAENLIPLAEDCLLPKICALRYHLTDTLGYIIPNIRVVDGKQKNGQYQIFVRGQFVLGGKLTNKDVENKNVDKFIQDLNEVCIKYAKQIMEKSSVLKLMELVKSQEPTLVNDLVPTLLSPVDLKKIFVALIQEGIGIKDIIYIFEILNDKARFTQNLNELFNIVKKELLFYKTK